MMGECLATQPQRDKLGRLLGRRSTEGERPKPKHSRNVCLRKTQFSRFFVKFAVKELGDKALKSLHLIAASCSKHQSLSRSKASCTF